MRNRVALQVDRNGSGENGASIIRAGKSVVRLRLLYNSKMQGLADQVHERGRRDRTWSQAIGTVNRKTEKNLQDFRELSLHFVLITM